MKQCKWKNIFMLGLSIVLLSITIMPVNAMVFKHSTEEYTFDINSSQRYELLIICPTAFTDTLQPLVQHKNSLDMRTKLVTLNEIYDQMFLIGRDQQEKIKYFIKTSIETWGVTYVLLVGGMKGQGPYWHLPVRYVYMDDKWEERYVSDLYYADIYDSSGNFSLWDSDGNAIYGEWIIGEEAIDKNIDLYPDIYVGRLPCRNNYEVKIMVDKIIKYEQGLCDPTWFNKMVVIAGDTYPECNNQKWKGYEGEEYADEALGYMSQFTPVKLYTSDGSLKGRADMITAIRKGCGFLYFVGHGSPMKWSTHLPNSTTRLKGFAVWHMPFLTNKDRLPICIVSGCHNSQFDVSLFKFFNKTSRYRGEYVPECWGWLMTRKINGGSIATIGCSALGYTKEDKDSFEGGLNGLEVTFFYHYGQNNTHLLGKAWADAITSYLDMYPIEWVAKDGFIDAKVVQSWVLFGDPSLKIGGYT